MKTVGRKHVGRGQETRQLAPCLSCLVLRSSFLCFFSQLLPILLPFHLLFIPPCTIPSPHSLPAHFGTLSPCLFLCLFLSLSLTVTLAFSLPFPMKFLQLDGLETLNSALAFETPECRVFGSIEPYSCKLLSLASLSVLPRLYSFVATLISTRKKKDCIPLPTSLPFPHRSPPKRKNKVPYKYPKLFLNPQPPCRQSGRI